MSCHLPLLPEHRATPTPFQSSDINLIWHRMKLGLYKNDHQFRNKRMNYIVLISKRWALWALTVQLTVLQPHSSSSPWIKVTRRHLITFLSARAECEGTLFLSPNLFFLFSSFFFHIQYLCNHLQPLVFKNKSYTLPLYSSHAHHHSRSSVGCLGIPRSSESSAPWTRSLSNPWFPPVQTSSVGPWSSWEPLQPEMRGGRWTESLWHFHTPLPRLKAIFTALADTDLLLRYTFFLPMKDSIFEFSCLFQFGWKVFLPTISYLEGIGEVSALRMTCLFLFFYWNFCCSGRWTLYPSLCHNALQTAGWALASHPEQKTTIVEH